jgi:hypothetical protein
VEEVWDIHEKMGIVRLEQVKGLTLEKKMMMMMTVMMVMMMMTMTTTIKFGL